MRRGERIAAMASEATAVRERRSMSVEDVVGEVAERGWLLVDETRLYEAQMWFALTAKDAGMALARGPREVFEELCVEAGLRGNVRAYYAHHFEQAMGSRETS